MTMKNEITFTGQHARMTHKQIAELVNSRPDNVKVSIERLADRGVIRLPALQEIEEINNLGLSVTREYYCFEGEQGKRDSIVVVAQLSPEFTAQIVDEWQALEKAVDFLRIPEHKPVQQEIGVNPGFIVLTKSVAEATAAGVMKSILETTGIQAVVHIDATVSALPAALPEDPALHHIGHVTPEDAEEPEYVPVHKVSWATGLSDPTCRRLVTFYDLPNCQLDGVRGLCVHREFFMAAVEVLIKESTPPAKGRKRWHHPEFGGFELRKDPNEIFGEGNHGE